MFSKWVQSAKESASQFLSTAGSVIQEVGDALDPHRVDRTIDKGGDQ